MNNFIENNPIKLTVIGFLIVSIGFCIYYSYWTAPPGYCSAERKFVPDERLIQKSIETQKEIRKFDGKSYSLINCCTISRIEGGFWSKVLSADEGVIVSWSFERSDEHRDPKHGTFPEQLYGSAITRLDSCGYVITDQTFVTNRELPRIILYGNSRYIKWTK